MVHQIFGKRFVKQNHNNFPAVVYVGAWNWVGSKNVWTKNWTVTKPNNKTLDEPFNYIFCLWW